jgi:streptogramin lyase
VPFQTGVRIATWLWCLFILLGPAPVSASPKPVSLPRATISPSLIRLAPGTECRFKVVLDPRRLEAAAVADKVNWSVNDIPGGNEQLGTIDTQGLYHTPKEIPQPNEIHICAYAEEAANHHLWATVIIGNAEPLYVRVTQLQEPTDGSGHLKDPSGLAIEKDGNLLISDASCSQVFRYSPQWEFLGTIGLGQGNKEGNLDTPRSIVVDSTGTIYVSDLRTGPPRLQAFSPDGHLLRAFAQKGVGPGKVMEVRGMTIDENGRLLVADMDNMRVNIYGPDGSFIETWEKDGTLPGQFNEPYGLFADSNSDVFVMSYYGPCQKFTSQGDFLFAFAHPDPPDGPVVLTSVSGDRWGNVYLAVRDSAGLVHNSVHPEPKPARLMKFNNNGDLVTTIPLWGDERGENPTAIDSQGRLHVLYRCGNGIGVTIFEHL